jgi:hypothetical protein
LIFAILAVHAVTCGTVVMANHIQRRCDQHNLQFIITNLSLS